MSKVKNVASTLAAKRTEEKLSALSSLLSTSLDDLAESYTTSDEIRPVRFHFHTPPMSVDIGKLDFMRGLSVKEAEYVRNNGSNLKFSCFPREAKKLKSICESVRNYLKGITVGNSDYMEAEDFYKKFLPYLYGKDRELRELKEEISEKYEREIEAFSENVLSVVKSVCPEREGMAKASILFITGRTKESFLESISFDIETKFTEENLSSPDLSSLLRESKRAFALREIEGIYVGQLQQLWGAMCHYVTIIKSASESLAGYKLSRRGLREAAEKIEGQNIGAIPVITDLSAKITELSKEENKDLACTESFYIMAEIFGKGSEFGASFRFSEDLPEWVRMEDLMEAYKM